jgi:hypothetical protein
MHSCVDEGSRTCTSKALGSFDVILCRRCLVSQSCIFFAYACCLSCYYEAFTNTTVHVNFYWLGLITAACFLHFTVIWDTFSILAPVSNSWPASGPYTICMGSELGYWSFVYSLSVCQILSVACQGLVACQKLHWCQFSHGIAQILVLQVLALCILGRYWGLEEHFRVERLGPNLVSEDSVCKYISGGNIQLIYQHLVRISGLNYESGLVSWEFALLHCTWHSTCWLNLNFVIWSALFPFAIVGSSWFC